MHVHDGYIISIVHIVSIQVYAVSIWLCTCPFPTDTFVLRRWHELILIQQHHFLRADRWLLLCDDTELPTGGGRVAAPECLTY